MSQEIEDFVDDLLEGLQDRMEDFLEKRDREYKERAKLGVQIDRTFGGYNATIGGITITIERDSSRHKWYFKDEDYHQFFELSEKKGEAVIQFLQELAKKSSSRISAATEENLAKDLHEEIIAERPLDPAAEDEENIEDEERII